MIDVDDLRVELTVASEEAFAIADRLADLAATRVVGEATVAKVAREYQERRADVKRLRRAVAFEVNGG